MKLFLSIFCVLLSAITMAQENIFWNRDFWTPNRTLDEVKKEIKNGNDPTALNPHGFDATANAILGKAPNEIIEYLLTIKGNEVNKLTHDGRTYVFWAAYMNNLPMVKKLFQMGSKADATDDKGYPLFVFTAFGKEVSTKVFDEILKNGGSATAVSPNGVNALLIAAGQAKNLSELNYFVKKGLSLESSDKQGCNVIDYAARRGNKDLINQLIAQGISYKDTNKDGSNAVLIASEGYRRDVNTFDFFKYLVEELEIPANVEDEDGVNPLHNLARSNIDIALFDYLIKKGNDPKKADKKGNTPLINSAYRNNLEVVKYFADKSDVNTQNSEGKSALTYAIRYNKSEVAQYLIEKTQQLPTDQEGNNLAAYLVESYSAKQSKDFDEKWGLLAKRGLDFAKTQGGGNTLYHLAVEKQSPELLDKIKGLNIDINQKNDTGLTALHKAVMESKNLKVIQKLLELGVDKSITTNFDETTYELAKENELLRNESLEFLK